MDDDGVPSTSGVAEVKKNSFNDTLVQLRAGSNALLLLSMQCKDLENHYDAMHRAIEQRWEDIRVREESLQSRFRGLESEKRLLEERCRIIEAKRSELDALWESIDGKCRDLERRESEFGSRCRLVIEDGRREVEETVEEVEWVKGEVEMSLKEISRNETEFEAMSGSIVQWINERFVEIEAREKQLNLEEEERECKKKKFEERLREFETTNDQLDERVRAVVLREKQYERRLRELELTALEVETDREKFKELELKDSQFKEREKEIESRNKGFESQRKELELKILELEAYREKSELRLGEMELKDSLFKEREKEIESRNREIERQRKELELKTQELESHRKKLDKKDMQFKDREKEIESRNKDIERQKEELGWKRKNLEVDRKKLDERIHELKHKECQVDARLKELEIRNKDQERQRKELQSDKRGFKADRKKLDEPLVEVESYGKKFDVGKEGLELRNKDLERQDKELELDKRKFGSDMKKLDERLLEVKLNAKQSNDNVKEREVRNKELEGQQKTLKLDKRDSKMDGKKPDERRKEVESRELERRGCTERMKQKEKCPEGWSARTIRDGSNTSCLSIDGKTLQIFLNECWRGHDWMGAGVSVLLRLSADPAKLVLDALRGFYPPHLRNGLIEFPGATVRRSCIFLLEQLMKISPVVKPDVKTEAKRLSFCWITKLKEGAEHNSRTIGFLLLVAAYGLAPTFDGDELLKYIKRVAHCRHVTKLCMRLGIKDKIPDLVQDLIERKHHLVAIRIASEFNLLEQFPPDPLFEDLMESSKNKAQKMIENGHNSLEAQIQAMHRRIDDLKAIVRCIENYNITSGKYLPTNLRQKIASLEKCETELRKAARVKLQELKDQNPKLHDSPKSADPILSMMPTSTGSTACRAIEKAGATAAETQLCQQIGSNHSHATPTCEASPNSLVDSTSVIQSIVLDCQPKVGSSPQGEVQLQKRRKLLDGTGTSAENMQRNKPESTSVNLEVEVFEALLGQDVDFKSMQHEVVKILHSLSNPAKTIFHFMKRLKPSESSSDECFELAIPVDLCILLLKELKKVSHVIEPQINAEARKFAETWKANLKMKKGDHMEVACFLLFLEAYKLVISFNAEEVTALLGPLPQFKQLHEIFQHIGMADFLPDFVQNLIEMNHRIKAARYIHALDLGDRFPIGPLVNDHLLYWKKTADELCSGPNVSLNSQVNDINKRLAAVNSAIKLVKECDIMSADLITELDKNFQELSQQKTEKRSNPKDCEAGQQKINAMKRKYLEQDRKEGPGACASSSSKMVATTVATSTSNSRSQARQRWKSNKEPRKGAKVWNRNEGGKYLREPAYWFPPTPWDTYGFGCDPRTNAGIGIEGYHHQHYFDECGNGDFPGPYHNYW